MSDDEDFSTILAYNKNPKASKRTSFQEELQKAISARVARQATEEPENPEYFTYSDELDESEDDEFLKEARIGKAVFGSFQLSEDEEDKPHKISFLKSKSPGNIHGNNGLEYSANHRKLEGGRLNSSLVPEHQKEWKSITHEGMVARPVPIPKPRELRTRSTPAAEGTAFSTLEETFKPTPHQRTVLRKNSPVEEKEATRMEAKVYNFHSSSLSAPSSLTRLSDKVSMSEKKTLSESFSSEGLWPSSPPSVMPSSRRIIASTDDMSGDSFLTACIEEPYMKELEWQEMEAHSDQSKNNGSRSPSVLELMMTTAYEKSKLQEKCLDDVDSDGNESVKHTQIVTSKPKQRLEHFIDYSAKEFSQDKYEQNKIEQKTIKDENTKNKEIIESKNLRNKEDVSERTISPVDRNIRSSHAIKKTGFCRNSSAKSRYLGTLMVLDNKQLEKSASDLEEADALRATVYQDWLEKKRIFLQELQKIKRKEEEKEKEKKIKDGGTKKEEAIASFKAWKAMKTKELQKSLLKLKEEEEKKQKEMQELTEKREQSKKATEDLKKKARWLRLQKRR
ncbi:microtubule-associated protein 9 isoform X2 [Rhinatrema bivittatum]|uniref:microtubule-associated protein 9 isoform X2 n=1 Tax=Rhinatrema bivittatum TaxID=194408 RepID=UPI0011280BB7|nr:microtubule-associated protein 9 isoform X2 [Rhinatrema bivittatum]